MNALLTRKNPNVRLEKMADKTEYKRINLQKVDSSTLRLLIVVCSSPCTSW